MEAKRTMKDIEMTVREMDNQYDANFGEWVRNEDNLHFLASNFKKYIDEYTVDTVAEVMKWVTSRWRMKSVLPLLQKLFVADIFRDGSSSGVAKAKRRTKILSKIIHEWTASYASELIMASIGDMTREQKKLFLLWLLRDFDHQKITEIFIRIDSIVDWSLKISIIKSCRLNLGSSDDAFSYAAN